VAAPYELKHFLDDEERLTQWPSKREVQLIAIDFLAGRFEIERIYSEREVNTLLNKWHTFGDPALLRRELFERGYLNRSKDGSEYWATPNTTMLG
jgi:hypothetical protein